MCFGLTRCVIVQVKRHPKNKYSNPVFPTPSFLFFTPIVFSFPFQLDSLCVKLSSHPKLAIGQLWGLEQRQQHNGAFVSSFVCHVGLEYNLSHFHPFFQKC
jgi:hypothetical protein